MHKLKSLDKPFLWTVIILVLFGFTVFYSATTGLVVQEGLGFYNAIINQFLLGVVLGGILMFSLSFINHNYFKKFAILIFIIVLILNFLPFVPGIGFENGGAIRWIRAGNYSFQPSELLKIASILFFAAWLNFNKKKIREGYFAIISLVSTIILISAPLLLQKDFDVIFIISAVLLLMYFVSRAPLKHGIILFLLISILGATLIFTVPYIKSRVLGFINPNENAQTINYQFQQSQIAIGSGGIIGKGFGQSTQKFGSLPEPTNDSIFAVLAEEFGLIGTTALIILYLFFLILGYKISTNATSIFGSLFVFGVVTLIFLQSFMNIASMIGFFPITGQPLVFVSHGGTSLFVTLSAIGIILNISRK